MSRGTVFSEVKIESVIFLFQPQFSHAVQELVIIVFPLASADDLSDSRHKTVYRRDSLSVIILLHIESLDLLRIICHEYRTFIDLLRKISLMLSLKITAP